MELILFGETNFSRLVLGLYCITSVFARVPEFWPHNKFDKEINSLLAIQMLTFFHTFVLNVIISVLMLRFICVLSSQNSKTKKLNN